MNRITRNTTAIVTCLSLLMPQIAMAQESGQDKEAIKLIENLKKEAEKAKEEKKKQAEARKKAREEERKEVEKAREARQRDAEKAREEKKKAVETRREEQRKKAERARKQDESAAKRREERLRALSPVARQAAEATRAPEAAALDSLLNSGNVFRQVITDENSRSSDEDFATGLRDALLRDGNRRGEGERRKVEAKDRDDENDLTNALLLGLGALAVGSVLNNNQQVTLSSPDRVVLTNPDGSQQLVRDDVALLRQPGSNIETEQFDDGSSRTIVTRPDGSKVVTIRDGNMQVLRRTLISADGRSSRLIDDTEDVQPVDITGLPAPAPVQDISNAADEEALRAALQREANIDRRFTLAQIRNIHEVRSLVAPVDIPAITFESGSAAIDPDQAQQLAALGRVIQESIRTNPQEIYMIEGYTDTVGDPAMNLALSDRRAESVALALTEYFDVPPENLVVQGYGEEFLKVAGEGDIRANRRCSVRRITDLLQTASSK